MQILYCLKLQVNKKTLYLQQLFLQQSELPVLADTITSQTDTTLPHLEDTMTSPTITSPYSLSEDTDIAQYFSTSGDDIEAVTPVPDNKAPENNDIPNEPSTLPLQQNTK